MGYYDNVKENVKKQAADNSPGSSGSSSTSSVGGNFDTLKKAASETEPEDEKGDDTPIEVLEEDGLQRNPKRKESKSTESKNKRRESQEPSGEENYNSSSNPFKDKSNGDAESQSTEANLSGIEDRLDTIIEQNQELIEILRGFAK